MGGFVEVHMFSFYVRGKDGIRIKWKASGFKECLDGIKKCFRESIELRYLDFVKSLKISRW